MKLILIPDSFKGTMSSATVCAVMGSAIKKRMENAEIISIPVADGGEGTVDCFLAALGGKKITAEVSGVFGEKITAFYGMLPNGETAVIEMAACAGLLLAEGRLNPKVATTYGVGELMLHAARSGARHIILGLGGSATNDGGCGAAAAIGVRFTNADGDKFVPTGGTLHEIEKIDLSHIDENIKNIKITVMCDIDNPLYGKLGAAHVFAPQKGADAETVELLDEGLRHLSDKIIECTGRDFSALPGAGAAGGMGAGMCAFLGAELKMGIETVLDTVDFASKAADADYIFTGEGRLDSQSLRGKVIDGVAKRAKKCGVPVIAVVGGFTEGIDEIYAAGVTAVFSINTQAMDFSEARHFSEQNLETTMDNILRLIESK